MKYIGDYDLSTVIIDKFTTKNPDTALPYLLSGSPAICVYKDGVTTPSTAGVSLTTNFNSVVGLNHCAIDTSADGTFYSAGSFYHVVLSAGSVNAYSVTGQVICAFTLRKNSGLKPTVAGRALDVSAGGEAGIDWANIGSPSTSNDLSATSINSVDDVIGDVAGNVGGNLLGNVAGDLLGTVSSTAADAIADSVWDEAIAGHVTPGSAGQVTNETAIGVSDTQALVFAK